MNLNQANQTNMTKLKSDIWNLSLNELKNLHTTQFYVYTRIST